MLTLDAVRLFTVEEFQKMAEMGLFKEEERLELIQGQVHGMSPIGVNHAGIVTQLNRLLMGLFSDRYDIHIQNPVVLSDDSQPQPDVAVTTRRAKGSKMVLPTAADVFLLIEVSDSTLSYDRTVKVPLYALANIPEVWLINVATNAVTQYHTPENGLYTFSESWQKGDTIATTLGVSIAADDILL